MKVNQGFERTNHFPPLGSLEHLEFALGRLDTLSLWDKSQVAPMLEMFQLPESLAKFIFENQSSQYLKPKLSNIPDKTATIDTRHIAGYSSEPFINAEFNYDPFRDSNYVSILGRRRFAYDSDIILSYYLRMGLKNNQDLDRKCPIEAQITASNPVKANLLFRTTAKEDKKARHSYNETNPKIFIGTLGEVVNGFKEFVAIRDSRF